MYIVRSHECRSLAREREQNHCLPLITWRSNVWPTIRPQESVWVSEREHAFCSIKTDDWYVLWNFGHGANACTFSFLTADDDDELLFIILFPFLFSPSLGRSVGRRSRSLALSFICRSTSTSEWRQIETIKCEHMLHKSIWCHCRMPNGNGRNV